jgi:hypothetical protein
VREPPEADRRTGIAATYKKRAAGNSPLGQLKKKESQRLSFRYLND